MNRERERAPEDEPRWPVGHSIVDRIRTSVNDPMGPFVLGDDATDAFAMLYLTERAGCVPEALLEDELLNGIHAMYYAVLDGLRDELRERTPTRDSMWILVDPSYEDTTSFALITDEVVLCTGWRKAWHFYWESEEGMAEELEAWYQAAAARLAKSAR